MADNSTGHPVKFLFSRIKSSPLWDTGTKKHLLMALRPHLETRSVPLEQLVMDAAYLHAYAQWARCMTALSRSAKQPAKEQDRLAALVCKWSYTLAKLPSNKGLARRVRGSRRQVNVAAGQREIPPTRDDARGGFE